MMDKITQGYILLLCRVAVVAIEDYRKYKNYLAEHPDNEEVKFEIKQLDEYFKGEMFLRTCEFNEDIRKAAKREGAPV